MEAVLAARSPLAAKMAATVAVVVIGRFRKPLTLEWALSRACAEPRACGEMIKKF